MATGHPFHMLHLLMDLPTFFPFKSGRLTMRNCTSRATRTYDTLLQMKSLLSDMRPPVPTASNHGVLKTFQLDLGMIHLFQI